MSEVNLTLDTHTKENLQAALEIISKITWENDCCVGFSDRFEHDKETDEYNKVFIFKAFKYEYTEQLPDAKLIFEKEIVRVTVPQKFNFETAKFEPIKEAVI